MPRIAIAVDDQQVFWDEQSAEGLFVRRAPVGGAGPVETVGWFYGDDLSTTMLTVDADAVWWMRHNRLAHAPKHGGAAEEIVLDDKPGEWIGSLCDDGDVVWVVAFGCKKFARVHKRDGAVDLFPGPEGQPTAFGGATGATTNATAVLCANGPNVVAIDKATGVARRLVTGRDWTSYVASVDGRAFVTETLGGGVTDGQLLEVALATGAVRVAAPLDGAAGFLLHDRARATLYLHPGTTLVAYALENGTVRPLVTHSQRRGGGAMDDRFVYWMIDHAVVRFAK